MAIEKPIKEELAQTDQLYYSAGGFANQLIPQDTVLAQKGRDYRIYREVLRDDQCKSTFQQRRDAVTSCEWDVEPGGKRAIDKKAADSLKAQLEAIDWDRITDKMLYAVWYGHAVGECMWDTSEREVVLTDVRVRDRQRFSYDAERRLYLSRNGYELMPERKFWTVSTGADHDDEPYGLGLAHYCYWPVFFKRNDIKFWLIFLEKWAAPTIKGKGPAGILEDTVKRDQILAQLRSFATNTAILVPDGVEVELLEAARSGSSSYQDMAEAMDSAIAKIVLSQTMTTDNGSSRSQAEVHEGVRDMVVKADADLLSGSFAGQVARWLTEWNYPGAEIPRVWRAVEPPEDLSKRAERDAKIFALGYEPTEEYITETYGEGWQKKAVQTGLPMDQLGEIPNQLAAEFAELGVIAAAKGARRADQQELSEAATRFANKYPGVLGTRVQSILDHAENSGDYETMRKHLLAMMGQPPPQESSDAVFRSGLLARVLGAFRAQR
jgi:phage gp29-like protein